MPGGRPLGSKTTEPEYINRQELAAWLKFMAALRATQEKIHLQLLAQLENGAPTAAMVNEINEGVQAMIGGAAQAVGAHVRLSKELGPQTHDTSGVVDEASVLAELEGGRG